MRQRSPFRNKKRGASTVEVLVASSISAFVMCSLILALLSGMKSWTVGQSKINAEVSSANGMRSIVSELREAMNVSIDNDGMGLSFTLPRRADDGNYTVPPVSDGVSRRIFFHSASNSVRITEGSRTRTLARYVITTDPSRSGASYRLFTSTRVSTVIRQVDIRLVMRTTGVNDDDYNLSRSRETVVLRNVPVTTQ